MRHLMQGAYRLFFSAAGLFAALAILLWLAEYSGFDLNLPEGGLFWHRHEMLFGYLGLTLGGFLLTAVPNWTGRAAVTGLPLALLFCLWASGRVGVFLLPWGAVLVMAYPVALASSSAAPAPIILDICWQASISRRRVCSISASFACAAMASASSTSSWTGGRS